MSVRRAAQPQANRDFKVAYDHFTRLFPDEILENAPDQGVAVLAWTLQGHSGKVNCTAFSPDGNTIVAGSDDPTPMLWDVGTARLKATLNASHEGPVMSVAFSPDGETFASGSQDGTVKLWDAKTMKYRSTLPRTDHSGSPNSLVFFPDGNTIAFGSRNEDILLFDYRTGEFKDEIKRAVLGDNAVQYEDMKSFALSPDQSRLASCAFCDSNIYLWNLINFELEAKLPGHEEGVTSVAFSSDGETIASGSYDQSIKIWDANEKKCLYTIGGHSKTNKKCTCHNKTWPSQCKVIGHSNTITFVAFSYGGSTLASASQDSVMVWDLSFGAPRKKATILRRAGVVRSLAFSPDQLTLAAAFDDKTLQVFRFVEKWDVKWFQEDYVLALFMSKHPRLGGKSILNVLSDDHLLTILTDARESCFLKW